MTDRETLSLLTKCILNKNQGELLSAIDRISKLGKNITQLVKDLTSYIRDLMVVKSCKDYKEILKLPADQIADLESLSELASSENLIEILKKLSVLDNEFRYTTNPRSLTEITLLALCNFEMTEINELKMKVKVLESKLKG